MILEVFQEYCDISDTFDVRNKKLDAYLESTIRQFNIHTEQAELKVMQESGTIDDLEYLMEEANDGALAKVKAVIQKIIDAFKQFISDIKSKVVRIICNKETKSTLNKVQQKIKFNPILARKKVKVVDKKKPLKVIKEYQSKCDKHISQVKAGVFKEKEIQSIYSDKEKYDADYKKAIAGTAALVTVAVSKLIAEINAEYGQLPKHIDGIDKDTSEVLKNFISTLDKEEKAVAKGAYTACANFRTKLAKDEVNEHVDAIMQKLSVLKKEVLKVKVENVEESAIDEGYSEDDSLDGLFDGIMESTDYDDGFNYDEFMESASDADDLLDGLDNLF